MLNIFVSHAWQDKVLPQFGQLRSELAAYELWIDSARIAPGQHIRDVVTPAIEDADLVIVLWSAAAAASDEVRYELDTARRAGKLLVPCLLDKTSTASNEHLAGRLHIDLSPTRGGTLGWKRLSFFLTDFWLAKTEPVFIAGAENAEELTERRNAIQRIKDKQAALAPQLSVGQDAAFRADVGAPKRNASNPYVLNMLDAMKAGLGDATSDETLRSFLAYVEAVLSRYPNDDHGSIEVKKRLLLEYLDAVDRTKRHPSLEPLRALLLSWNAPVDDDSDLRT